MNQHFDVLIIGAGLSGIGTACHVTAEFPDKTIALLERRERLGGTWDLFRYPGVRSDSDMFTFGYKFRPWRDVKVLADGASIRQYIADTATEFGVDEKIHYGLKVNTAEWSSRQCRWTVAGVHEATGETRTYTCDYLISCTGYYNYDAGYLPDFPGVHGSAAGACTRSTGPKTSIIPARRSSSSAAAQRRSLWFRRWPAPTPAVPRT